MTSVRHPVLTHPRLSYRFPPSTRGLHQEAGQQVEHLEPAPCLWSCSPSLESGAGHRAEERGRQPVGKCPCLHYDRQVPAAETLQGPGQSGPELGPEWTCGNILRHLASSKAAAGSSSRPTLSSELPSLSARGGEGCGCPMFTVRALSPELLQGPGAHVWRYTFLLRHACPHVVAAGHP